MAVTRRQRRRSLIGLHPPLIGVLPDTERRTGGAGGAGTMYTLKAPAGPDEDTPEITGWHVVTRSGARCCPRRRYRPAAETPEYLRNAWVATASLDRSPARLSTPGGEVRAELARPQQRGQSSTSSTSRRSAGGRRLDQGRARAGGVIVPGRGGGPSPCSSGPPRCGNAAGGDAVRRQGRVARGSRRILPSRKARSRSARSPSGPSSCSR